MPREQHQRIEQLDELYGFLDQSNISNRNIERDGITSWVVSWKARDWRTADRKAVKNDDLWRQLDELCARHTVQWHWLKGHAGHPENERVDQLASDAAHLSRP